MSSPTLIGTALRDARRAQGLDITACAEAIYVRARYLTAIEDGRFGDLPDPAYVAGFVRAYADFLGVDLEGFAEPDRELPVRSDPVQRVRPVYITAARGSGRGSGRGLGPMGWLLLLVLAAVIVAAVALWAGVIDIPSWGDR